MTDPQSFSAITVTISTRHRGDCPLKSEPRTRKCGYTKWLRIYANGKGHRKSNKSTSWKTAEVLAAAERESLSSGRHQQRRW